MVLLPMRAILFLLAILLAMAGSHAGEIPGPARGLAIYKPSAFRPDSTAVLMEYLSQTNHSTVTFFVTLKGRRITVPNGRAEIIFLPYPGRGEATPEQAFALLELAKSRFPQFEAHYRIYDYAWREESKRPVEEIETEIVRRAANEKSAGDFATWVRSLFPGPGPLKLPPNPLGPTVLNPAPTPTPETTSEGQENTTGDESGQGTQPQTIDGMLKQIQDFYRLSDQLSNEN
jgi:hypothetical protein